MTTALGIIDKFGGARALAALLNKTPSTVQSWKDSGFIPARHQRAVLEAAKTAGIDLIPDDFISPRQDTEARA